MKKSLVALLIIAATFFALPNRSVAADAPGERSFAYRWLDIILECSARDVDRRGARPTILSRTMSIACTAMYDAWCCYDEKAVGTCFGGDLRRPQNERTQANKEKAIAYAVYRVLMNIQPEDKEYLDTQMRAAGFDPIDKSVDPGTPQGIGNRVSQVLIDSREHDGANQLGDEIGSNGKPYSDYTYYKPADSGGVIVHPDRWQPIPFSDGKGGTMTVGFLTPHWYRVKPFALKSSSQFRPPPPRTTDLELLKKETLECIDCNGKLSDTEKAVVEFMRDGPRSTGQSGHWLKFAQDVSRRDKNDLDRDVKLFFAVANTAFDAFISCWETKRFYDTSRPYWYARYFFKDADITGWGGPGKGFVQMKGKDWLPYSPPTFITPPFPGYTSGHATVSGACAKILELFTGNDFFGSEEVRPCCKLTEPTVPGLTVHLKLPTFTAAAEMAALSRMLGGYHIRTDNEVGLKTGQKIGEYEWPVFQAYFDGTIKK